MPRRHFDTLAGTPPKEGAPRPHTSRGVVLPNDERLVVVTGSLAFGFSQYRQDIGIVALPLEQVEGAALPRVLQREDPPVQVALRGGDMVRIGRREGYLGIYRETGLLDEERTSLLIPRALALISMSDQGLSRTHAEIAIGTHYHMHVTDLGSTNGTDLYWERTRPITDLNR